MKISSEFIFQVTGKYLKVKEIDCGGLGLVDDFDGNNKLSFICDRRYIEKLNKNISIGSVFCSQNIANSGLVRHDIQLIIVDDPQWYFFSIVDYFGKNKIRSKSFIDKTVVISDGVYISPVGVTIGKNCFIEPNVTILSDVNIGNNVTIRSGAVIGIEGFEHKKTSKGLLSVTHDGIVSIKDYVEIGANSHIAKGFSYRSTIIGENTKIDALVHYAHGVQSGKNCLIAAKAMIAGNVTIGNNVWIGPGSVISNRVSLEDNSRITLGSVVVERVYLGQTVTGNFAVPHMRFLRNFKRIFSQ